MANIRLDTGAVPQPDPRRAGEAARNAPTGKAADAAGGARALDQGLPADTVELSADAQQVSGGEAVPKGSVLADRIREIGAKLASGHYDTPEVRDTVADKIKGDLGIG
jgi:hypothetical protein